MDLYQYLHCVPVCLTDALGLGCRGCSGDECTKTGVWFKDITITSIVIYGPWYCHLIPLSDIEEEVMEEMSEPVINDPCVQEGPECYCERTGDTSVFVGPQAFHHEIYRGPCVFVVDGVAFVVMKRFEGICCGPLLPEEAEAEGGGIQN